MVNDTIMLITALLEIHVVSEMRQYPKIYIKSETLRLYDSTSGCQRRREPLCTWLMGAQGGWMSLGIFLGWATGKSTLRRGCPGLFWIGSLRVRLNEGRQEEGSRERKSAAKRNKREGKTKIECGQVWWKGGGNGRGQKPSARICYAPWILDANHKKEPFIGNQEPTICPASRGSRKPRTSRLPTSRTLGNGCFLN